MAQDLARQPDDVEITVPNNATFNQMVQLDMQMIDMQTGSGSSNQSIELDIRITFDSLKFATQKIIKEPQKLLVMMESSINNDQHEQEMEAEEAMGA
ncbi:hypothetical protein HDU77_002765 [Chytriomyces hyalinus]|nr:hypothetical protein HDU77_002765 [Chytriomyces hyalinus]